MSTPLVINKATGKKFGKSEGGAVWLDPELTSPYKFYQFWLNVDDEGVEDYLKVYTLLSKPEIEQIMERFRQNSAERHAQKVLAYEVTKLVHGTERADSVKRISEVLFGGGEYTALQQDDFVELGNELGMVQANTLELAQLLVDGQLASSKSEARRFISQGAVYANGQQLGQQTTDLTASTAIHGFVVIRRGKNTQTIFQFT